jgi:hypothetical protein
MPRPIRFLNLSTCALLCSVVLSPVESLAQGPRTTIIPPSDLWMRADASVGHGEPVLVSTCEGVGAIHESEEIIEGLVEGSQTIVRTFSVNCPCDEVEVMARQYIHIMPATPLPESLAPGGCAPAFSVTPSAVEIPFGSPRITAAEAAAPGFRTTETEHMLWQNDCGLGAKWIVWEATGPCGDVSRHAFKVTTVPQSAAMPSLSGDLTTAVDLDGFDAADFGAGPLPMTTLAWSGLKPIELYRNLSNGSTFERIAVGCGAGSTGGGSVVGVETIEVSGNYEPWLGFVDDIEIACGTPTEEWPLIRARDRVVGGFGAGLQQIAIPFTETVDTLTGNCPGNFTIERHISAIDDDGAEATGVQRLHVTDMEAPEFYGSPEELVWDGDDWPPLTATAQAVDGCSGEVDVTWADSTDCAGGRIIRINTAADGCGNRATLRQVILPREAIEQVVLAVGCSDPEADNYTPDACFATEQCLYHNGSACLGDMDENGQISTNDLLLFLGIFGTYCEATP